MRCGRESLLNADCKHYKLYSFIHEVYRLLTCAVLALGLGTRQSNIAHQQLRTRSTGKASPALASLQLGTIHKARSHSDLAPFTRHDLFSFSFSRLFARARPSAAFIFMRAARKGSDLERAARLPARDKVRRRGARSTRFFTSFFYF